MLQTTEGVAQLSIEPNVNATNTKGKSKRRAIDEDDVGDLYEARRLRRKQDKEDDIMIELQEKMNLMKERKRSRESKIEQCTKGKTPKDYEAYFMKSIRPKVIIEENEDEDSVN